MNYSIVGTHIKDIKQGDTVLHNNILTTVCNTNIKNGFNGVTLFGDSYSLGQKRVLKATNLKG